jgi:hypothetical protein
MDTRMYPLDMGGSEYLAHQARVRYQERMRPLLNKQHAADEKDRLLFYYCVGSLLGLLENPGKTYQKDTQAKFMAAIDAHCAVIAAGGNPGEFKVNPNDFV